MKKIILFGGTFDPIHNGHLHIAKETKKALSADEVIFIIAKTPRWKKDVTNSINRVEMLNLALKDYKDFYISTAELDRSDDISYTYDTVKEFVAKEKAEYYLLIGLDQQVQLHKWYEIDKLSSICKIVCYGRNNGQFNQENISKYNLLCLDLEEYDESSTNIRNGSSFNAPIEVLNYIADNNLYYIKIIKDMISEKRFKHSLSVANLCYQIALNNGLNPFKAYCAGLFHDIGKDVTLDKTNQIMNKHFKEYSNMGEYALHQFVGAYLVEELFNIKDKDIIDAIKYHCTGNENMNPYGEILYASDKIDPLRGYNSSYMIDACLKDYHKGFRLVLKENIIFYATKNIKYINELTDKCLRYYKPMKGE